MKGESVTIGCITICCDDGTFFDESELIHSIGDLSVCIEEFKCDYVELQWRGRGKPMPRSTLEVVSTLQKAGFPIESVSRPQYVGSSKFKYDICWSGKAFARQCFKPHATPITSPVRLAAEGTYVGMTKDHRRVIEKAHRQS